MIVSCAGCGKGFEAKTRRAKWCGATCRKRGETSRARERAAGPGRTGSRAAQEVRKATHAELRRLGVLSSLEGRRAMLLVERMVDPSETGSSVASLDRALSALMDEVRAKAAKRTDPVAEARARGASSRDELAERRGRAATT